MSKRKPPRIERPLLERVGALDDHLSLLRDARHNLSRDDALLKIIASELRLLICKSSSLEGLLWRLTRQMKVDESVYVHIPGEVNPDHLLSKGLQFMHMPLYRGGESDPRIPVGQLSFRLLVKKRTAIFVEGKRITHEDMIDLVANQIGSSHEGDKVSHDLHILRNIYFLQNQPPFFDVLARDAEFTLEIGERVIEKAEAVYGFKRKSRPGYGDFSIIIRTQLNEVLKEPIRVASFESAVSKLILNITVSETTVSYQFTKSGNPIAVEAPLLPGWKPNAVSCLSYSSRHELARVIVNGVAMPEVKAPLGFVDIGEMEKPEVLPMQLVLLHKHLLSSDQVKSLAQGEPPSFGGLFEPEDSEHPVFP